MSFADMAWYVTLALPLGVASVGVLASLGVMASLDVVASLGVVAGLGAVASLDLPLPGDEVAILGAISSNF